MNIEKLNEMADYLDKGDFGGRTFNMGCYHDCVLGHYVARERNLEGQFKSEDLALIAPISQRVFGIKQSVQIDEWHFAFGAQWGNDPHAAANRLRYLARHGGAPDRSVWDKYRSATDAKAAAQYEPISERCSWQGATWNTEEEAELEEELVNA